MARPTQRNTPFIVTKEDGYSCDSCGARREPLVVVGEYPDYETRTATLCEACVRQALAMIEAARPPVRRWRVWGNAVGAYPPGGTMLQAESAQEAADVWAWRMSLTDDTEVCVAEADEQGIVRKGTMVVSVTGSALRHLERVRGEKP